MRPSHPGRARLRGAAAVVLAVIAASCGGGTTPTVARIGSTTTTTAPAGGSASSGQTQLAKAEAYSHCMRRHGVPNWPDPVVTPDGGYGFRTRGIDPHSAAFQGATQACNALVPGGWSGGRQLTPAQQQAWLTWAGCIRAHGVADFPDPTFSGSAVHVSASASGSPQLRKAMDACRSEMPPSGGLGG